MKSKVIIMFTAALITAASLSGCGEKEVPQEIVDNNQIISQANAEKNLKGFVNARFPTATMAFMGSDSSIRSTCRYGDGWASGIIQMPSGENIDVKCQTNGRGKGFSGCLTKLDFVKKDYAETDGNCDRTITSLPKFQ